MYKYNLHLFYAVSLLFTIKKKIIWREATFKKKADIIASDFNYIKEFY